MSVRVYGDLAGVPVRAVTLRGGGLQATVMEWGCVMLDLRLCALDRSLILSWPDFADYVRYGREHVGAIAGRVANRVRRGQFSLNGMAHQLDRNVEGRDHLHGGTRGFGQCLWQLQDWGPDHARLTICSADGDQGYPGAVKADCLYRLADGALTMEMSATCDAPTPLNLAQHNYYNLAGTGRIEDHVLEIAAAHYTPLGADMTPTGAVENLPVSLDFRGGRRVGHAVLDYNYVLSEAQRDMPHFAARLSAPDVHLTVETTEPGLQAYTSEHLPGRPRSGVCLEAQRWPDAVNHPHFPETVLRPGETYRQITVLKLTLDDAAPRAD
ncbi:MAG: aldose epimerase family protein [Pseudomonadota bacterium]